MRKNMKIFVIIKSWKSLKKVVRSRGTDQGIRIRTKMSRIPNTGNLCELHRYPYFPRNYRYQKATVNISDEPQAGGMSTEYRHGQLYTGTDK